MARPGDLVLGRYRLVEAVGQSRGTSLWQARDEVDDVAVTVRMTPLDSPIIAELRSAANRAASVDDVHASRVIEVANDRSFDALVIVSEFSKGLTLSDILVIEGGRPLLTHDAVTIAHEVSLLLKQAHSEGVYHGSITPDTVVVTLTGEVRLTGLEVDEVLHNYPPLHDRKLADIHAVGAILYAGLTGAWPDPHNELETSGSGFSRWGTSTRPSQVATGVPPDLDEFAVRALAPATETVECFASVDEVEAALAAWMPNVRQVAEPTTTSASRRPTSRRARRLRGLAISLGILMAISLFGLALALGLGSEPLTKPATHPSPSHSANANK